MKNLFILFVISLMYSACEQPPTVLPVALDTNKTLTTIAFGSCNKHDLPQPMWKNIIANQPDLWIWLGDNIYGDTEDMALMQAKYNQQNANTDYQNLRATCPIIGIWDDHDYGTNDGDKNYSKKVESKKLMLDFLDVPADAAVRQREGAYQSFTFGKDHQKIKIILLDARYFRDTLQKDASQQKRYLPNETGDILGDAQWDWLANELADTTIALNIIGCGIQVIAKDHRFEKWANFPKARKRLFELLETQQPNAAILLSGDRHIGEVSKIKLDGLPYDLYDITSSGLTHSYEQVGVEENEHRVGDKLTGVLHFGVMKIDWNATPLTLKVEMKNVKNQIIFEELIKF